MSVALCNLTLRLPENSSLKDKRVICLEIPDKYEYMDPELVQLLEAKVPRHLPHEALPKGESA